MKNRAYSEQIISKLLKDVEMLQGEGLDFEKSCKRLTRGKFLSIYDKEYQAKSAKIIELKEENQRLRKRVSDLSFDNEILKEMSKKS